jgi:hypothetical protein
VPRSRSYAAEYQARSARARGLGYGSYAQQRAQQGRQRARLVHPGRDFSTYADEPPRPEIPLEPTPAPDWDYGADPTHTSNPPRPRTLRARYSRNLRQLEVVFRDGESYAYFEVPTPIWFKFRDTESPGRYINQVLNDFDYQRGAGWGDIPLSLSRARPAWISTGGPRGQEGGQGRT